MTRRLVILAAVLAVLALGATACGSGHAYTSVGISAGPWGIQPSMNIGWTGRPF